MEKLTPEQFKKLYGEVGYQQVAGNQPQQPPKKEGFLKSLAKGAVMPFARVGASVANIADASTKLIKGDRQGASEAVDKTRTVFGVEAKPYHLQTDPGQTGIKKYLPSARSAADVAGGAAEIASWAVGGEGVKDVATQGAKGFIKQAAKRGFVEGATTGALQAGGASTQKEDASVGSVLKDTATGAAIGGAAGAAAGGVMAGTKAGFQKISELMNAIKPEELAKQEGVIGRIGRRLADAQKRRATLTSQPTRVQEAVKAGIPERAVDLIETTDAKSREQMRTMLNLAEQGKKSFRTSQHPVEVAGNSILDRVNYLRKAHSEIGKQIDATVTSVADKSVDVTPTFKMFSDDLRKMGVTIDDKGKLAFGNSAVTGSSEKSLLQDIFNKLKPDDSGSVVRSAKDVHTLRQRIFNTLDLGKKQGQLTDHASVVADNVRDFLKNDFVSQTGEVGTKYASQAQAYAQGSSALNEMYSLLGKKWNPKFDKLTALRAGEVGRRVLGNGSANAMSIITKLEDAAKAAGYKATDNPIDLLWFNDVLEDLVGSSQTGSLRGQVGRGVKDANVAGFVEDAVNGNKLGLAKKAVDFARGITPEEQLRALKRLLSE